LALELIRVLDIISQRFVLLSLLLQFLKLLLTRPSNVLCHCNHGDVALITLVRPSNLSFQGLGLKTNLVLLVVVGIFGGALPQKLLAAGNSQSKLVLDYAFLVCILISDLDGVVQRLVR
jgi:hypothetical protein